MVTRQRRIPEEVERPRESPEIMTKPLPQILEEMEASIKAAAEAGTGDSNQSGRDENYS